MILNCFANRVDLKRLNCVLFMAIIVKQLAALIEKLFQVNAEIWRLLLLLIRGPISFKRVCVISFVRPCVGLGTIKCGK